jgi:hypothetical protein
MYRNCLAAINVHLFIYYLLTCLSIPGLFLLVHRTLLKITPFVGNAPRISTEIRENLNVWASQIEPKTASLYSLHGSLVERQLLFRGGACSSLGNFIIFKLGLSLSTNENTGGLELAGHLEK